MIKNPKDFKLGVGFISLCLICLFYLITYQVGGMTEAESLLPILVTFFILALSVSLILSSLRFEPTGDMEPHQTMTLKPSKLVLVICIMIAYAWLMDVIGFVLCSFLAMIALFLTFGVRNYRKIGIITIVTLGVLYITFEKLLMAPLPIGSLIERFLD